MRAFLLALLLLVSANAMAADDDYLYYRDVNIPPFQTLREFFDLPERSGKYEVTLVSDDVGPLTFSTVKVREEHESLIKRSRSFKIGRHEFQAAFPNPGGKYDLIVTITNSNPTAKAKVSVYVVELP
ncbi:MAG: hypothetical protein R8K46_03945 [Mariprofundaceae bacterium]